MSRVVRISETSFQRLQKLAVPLEDTPSSVIERLLDFYDSQSKPNAYQTEPPPTHTRVPRMDGVKSQNKDRSLLNRPPRSPGAIVEIGGKRFNADSLADLYSQVLRFLDENGQLDKLKPYLPIATSKKRYLIAAQPLHPNGKGFVRPVEHRGYFMESHKDYKNGIPILRRILDRFGLSVLYVDNSSLWERDTRKS
jgi:hypothetical protein